jgi:hypothetical protein
MESIRWKDEAIDRYVGYHKFELTDFGKGILLWRVQGFDLEEYQVTLLTGTDNPLNTVSSLLIDDRTKAIYEGINSSVEDFRYRVNLLSKEGDTFTGGNIILQKGSKSSGKLVYRLALINNSPETISKYITSECKINVGAPKVQSLEGISPENLINAINNKESLWYKPYDKNIINGFQFNYILYKRIGDIHGSQALRSVDYDAYEKTDWLYLKTNDSYVNTDPALLNPFDSKFSDVASVEKDIDDFSNKPKIQSKGEQVYKELLEDPKWKAKRESILKRDKYSCIVCGVSPKDRSLLHVHHTYYLKGHKPWQYPDESLQTLCSVHHSIAHEKDIPIKESFMS